ncbi:hypothetical protein RhiirA5_415405 [Rhizophagus irregularis]|uniref:Uncharacterized protein n=1 Tax=Rhizophagus irregularis TaxID=588596 RepID=A0A2N0PS17_9GLOM|nr:hypothetical protein RhiirA5_415405 [Rhizophagus irregularis]GET61052.1 hypothetical protein RIR_jg10974.t1 [Rhizophagus irregularis DAOM 181602=DAOM 197198]
MIKSSIFNQLIIHGSLLINSSAIYLTDRKLAPRVQFLKNTTEQQQQYINGEEAVIDMKTKQNKKEANIAKDKNEDSYLNNFLYDNTTRINYIFLILSITISILIICN